MPQQLREYNVVKKKESNESLTPMPCVFVKKLAM